MLIVERSRCRQSCGLYESAFTGVEENVDDDPVEAVSQDGLYNPRLCRNSTAILDDSSIAVWIWLLSSRIFKAERFPPPGMALVRRSFE